MLQQFGLDEAVPKPDKAKVEKAIRKAERRAAKAERKARKAAERAQQEGDTASVVRAAADLLAVRY